MTCTTQKIEAETKRHQKRERFRRETSMSEPIPDSRRPEKLQKERMETWRAWRDSMKEVGVEGSLCLHKARASLPILLRYCQWMVSLAEGGRNLRLLT